MSIDYLVGKTNIIVDKQVIERLENITNLPDEKKDYIFNLIDMCLRDFKNRQAYAS